jgi:hypothetical protein
LHERVGQMLGEGKQRPSTRRGIGSKVPIGRARCLLRRAWQAIDRKRLCCVVTQGFYRSVPLSPHGSLRTAFTVATWQQFGKRPRRQRGYHEGERKWAEEVAPLQGST